MVLRGGVKQMEIMEQFQSALRCSPFDDAAETTAKYRPRGIFTVEEL